MSELREDQDYWAYLGSIPAWRTALRLAPSYVKHRVIRPFRRGVLVSQPTTSSDRRRGRHAAAALDMWIEGFLAALGLMLGIRLDHRSGALAVRYIRLMSTMNKEFEHRLATGKSLDLADILANPLVWRCQKEWEHHTGSEGYSGRVVKFMELADFVQDYAAYVSVTTRESFNSDPAAQVVSILLDSGGYLARLARLVAESRGRTPSEPTQRDCFNLGVAAKYADELADVRADLMEGRYNLLLALLKSRPAEEQAFQEAQRKQRLLSVRWWHSSAPHTFNEFTQGFLDYYGKIGSREFRRLCDVTMLRTAHRSSPQPTARAPRSVTEPPADPWR